MVNNKKEIDFGSDESGERQQLVWKGALVLLCLGIFALVMWSGARDPALRVPRRILSPRRRACTISRHRLRSRPSRAHLRSFHARPNEPIIRAMHQLWSRIHSFRIQFGLVLGLASAIALALILL